jgi:hypothetical protein
MATSEVSCAKGNCECPTLLREIISGQKALEERLNQRLDDGFEALSKSLNALAIRLKMMKRGNPPGSPYSKQRFKPP